MLNELKKMVIAQKSAGLPIDPPSEAAAGLHAALVEYDQVVSQAVIQTIQGGPVDDPSTKVQAIKAALAEQYQRAGSGREVETYRRYEDRLDAMLALVKQIAQEQER